MIAPRHTPTVYRRDHTLYYVAVVRTASGQPIHRATGKHQLPLAIAFADLLQRDIDRRAEAGDLLPPAPFRPWKPKKKKRTKSAQ